MDRIERIKKYKERRLIEREEEHVRNIDKQKELMARVLELEPRINELIQTANACVENGIGISSYVSRPSLNNLGFINMQSRRNIKELGILSSEHYELHNLRTDGTKCYAGRRKVKTGEERILKPRVEVLERFLEEFDDFEQEFYCYVDKTVGE